MSRSARIALLDVQIVDADELPFGRIDDFEIELEDGPPRVTAVLVGSEALGDRIGGRFGGVLAGVSSRLREPGQGQGPPRLPVESIDELEPLVRVKRRLEELKGVAGLERWLAHHLVERLPGSGDESE